MANGYSGYSGYNADSVKRQREVADALFQRAQRDRMAPVQHWSQGVARLAEALMARQADDRATASESAFADSQKQAGEAMVDSMFPSAKTSVQSELAAPKSFDLTPAAMANRNTNNNMSATLGGQVKALANYTGDLTAALGWGQGQQKIALENKRYDDELAYGRGRDARADFVADRTHDTSVDQFNRNLTQDADQFGQTMGHNRSILGETKRHNMATEATAAAEAATKAASATTKPSPMQTAVDKNWADDLVNWQINGAANFGKQMSQLSGAVHRLKGGEELSGPGTTALVGPLRDWFGQAGKDVQQQIQEVIQSSLREVLGAQFTQKEGEGIMARTFDPTLEEGVNAQRAERLIAQLQLAAQQKNNALAYFNAHGTMNGYQGHVPSVADFNAAIGGGDADFDNPNLAAGVSAPIASIWAQATPAQREDLYARMTPEQRGLVSKKPAKSQESSQIAAFMQSLPAELQDPDLIARIEATLGSAEPTTEDLVRKWAK